MISIYICDDDQIILKEIASKIQRKLMIENYDMKVAGSYTRPQELLKAVHAVTNRCHIYFLDVELKDAEYDGFLLGKEIRRFDPGGIIVYITSFQDLAYKTFQYHIEAFDYIIKDVKHLDVSLDHCLQEIEQKLVHESKTETSSMVTIKVGESIKHLDVKDIYFFETSVKSHHVIVHTRYGRIDFVGNLNEIEQQLGDGFMRIHRSYLISLQEVQEINLKQNYVMVGKQKCLISRKSKSKLLQYLNRS